MARKTLGRRDGARGERPRGSTGRATIPLPLALRMFLLGSVAVLASAYALVRHYTREPTPMLVPAPATTEVPIEYDPGR